MALLGFGGHPVLHDYNYSMFREQQAELLRQAEYERLVRAAKLQQRNRRFYRRFANWLGTQLVQWGRKLERVGGLREKRPVPSASPHH